MAGKSNIKKEKQHKKTRDNRGFTLVELIVTLVVLMILLSVSVVGIMAWTEWTEFKKQNEYAQTIFVNAQNQMTEYSVGGKLPVIKEALSSSDGSLSTELTADKLRSMKRAVTTIPIQSGRQWQQTVRNTKAPSVICRAIKGIIRYTWQIRTRLPLTEDFLSTHSSSLKCLRIMYMILLY